jgi:hypothetical protein
MPRGLRQSRGLDNSRRLRNTRWPCRAALHSRAAGSGAKARLMLLRIADIELRSSSAIGQCWHDSLKKILAPRSVFLPRTLRLAIRSSTGNIPSGEQVRLGLPALIFKPILTTSVYGGLRRLIALFGVAPRRESARISAVDEAFPKGTLCGGASSSRSSAVLRRGR